MPEKPKIIAVNGELVGIDSGGYVKWPNGMRPKNKQEAIEILYTFGYCRGNPTYVAGAILDGKVEEAMRGEQHIVLVYETVVPDVSFGWAYQVYPLLVPQDVKTVERTFVGGMYQDSVLMFKDAKIEPSES